MLDYLSTSVNNLLNHGIQIDQDKLSEELLKGKNHTKLDTSKKVKYETEACRGKNIQKEYMRMD